MQNYWGGVVYAKSSTFENNRRGVAFMPYARENKSAFKSGCMFREPNGQIPGTRGVSIWDCHGIDFSGNFFEDLDIAGIYGIDFGLTNVTLNRFERCFRAIEIYNTLPISTHQFRIGNKPEDRNRFLDNPSAGIYAESGNRLASLQVFNNYFESSGQCVYVSGPAKYDIRHNTFKESAYGLYARNTGSDDNRLWCNTFRYPGSHGTYLNRNNEGLELRYNDYIGTPTQRDNTIEGALMNPSDVGKIFSSQGGDNDPADNCFSAPNNAFGTIGYTSPFDYYVPTGAVNTPECSVLPTSLPAGIELELTTNNPGGDCDNEDLPELPVFDKPDLELARQIVTQTEAAWSNNRSHSNHVAYQKALREKNNILQALLLKALDAQNHTEAITLLNEEATPEAQQWLMSVKLLAKDFTGAQQVWNALPSATQEEQWFRDLMQVNLQRLQNLGTFSLSPTQAVNLYNIAYSDSPYRSYARSLLVLLKEDRFPLDEVEEMQMVEAPQAPQTEQVQTPIAQQYSISPNPANEYVVVRYPIRRMDHAEPAHLQLFYLNGRSAKHIVLGDGGQYELETRNLPAGIYLLRIDNKSGVLYQTKLVVLP